MEAAQRMRLYAAGFNAWNQLSFDEKDIQDEPRDIPSFQAVLDGRNIEIPTSGLSYTLVVNDSEVLRAGSSLPRGEQETHLALNRAENALGEILAVEASRGKQPSTLLRKFPDRDSHKKGESSHSWPCSKSVKQTVACDVGWVILYNDGTVATLGDARFGDCLGREVTDESPAGEPGDVPDLNNLGEPIRKVAAGGYTALALTESGGLYAWGMETPGTHRREQGMPGLNGIPNYVEVDDDKDVEDVAVGESHAIALTTDRSVYVIGGNENGQLGMGNDFTGRAPSWTKLDLSFAEGCRAVKVGAGPRSSFILVAIETVDS